MATLSTQIATAIFLDGRTRMSLESLSALVSRKISALEGYSFARIAELVTSPGMLAGPTVFAALTQGTYPGFSDISVDDGEIALIGWDGSEWTKTTVYAPVPESVKDYVLEFVTWEGLKARRDAGALNPGAMYRITDYVATTSQEGTRAVSHPFDIIVKAVDASTLSEDALAALHDEDDYFSRHGARLEGWKLRYCIDNDTTRFAWADEEDGRGVVYRLTDEWNNSAPFDFKGIQAVRDADFWANHSALADNLFAEGDPGEDVYLYLFTCIMEDGEITDASVCAQQIPNDDDQYAGVVENYFEDATEMTTRIGFETEPDSLRLAIAKNVLAQSLVFEDFFYGFYNNTFGGSVYNNTFGGDVTNNTFGGYVYNNTFGGYVHNNTFGGSVYNNTFGGSVYNNTFGGDVAISKTNLDLGYNRFEGDLLFLDFRGNGGTGTIMNIRTAGSVIGKSQSNMTIVNVRSNAKDEQVVTVNSSGALVVYSPADLAS